MCGFAVALCCVSFYVMTVVGVICAWAVWSFFFQNVSSHLVPEHPSSLLETATAAASMLNLSFDPAAAGSILEALVWRVAGRQLAVGW